VVEVAHEAIFTHWPRLKNWIAATSDAHRLRRQVREAAAQWDACGQAKKYLWPDERVVEAADMLERLGLKIEDLSDSERCFLGPIDHDAMLADGVADAEHGWFEVAEIQRPVAADVPAAEAVLMCTWREVLGGFGDFNLAAGQDILVFGAGPVGLSFVKFARLLGLGWVGSVDPAEGKRQRALALGADAVFAPDDPTLARLIAARGKPLDAVIDAVGNPACINAGLPLLKLGGSLCVYGVLAEPRLVLNKAATPRVLHGEPWKTTGRQYHPEPAVAGRPGVPAHHAH